MRRFRGTLILDSPTPSTTPHIVINAPPPQPPWIAWANRAPGPQDARGGYSLCVPGIPVMNPWVEDGWLDDDGGWISDEAYEGVAEHYVGEGEEKVLDDETSPNLVHDAAITIEVLEVDALDDAVEDDAEVRCTRVRSAGLRLQVPDAGSEGECESRPETPTPGTPPDLPLSFEAFDERQELTIETKALGHNGITEDALPRRKRLSF
jgi:hypothetical protein